MTDISLHPSDVATLQPAEAGLKKQLSRSRRLEKLKALGLIAPLFVFLMVIFVVPIGLLLTRSVDNREMALTLNRTQAALAAWGGEALPPDSAFDALAADFRQSPRDSVADVAKRLNYYRSGLRSIVLKTARAVGRVEAPYRPALINIDEAWGEVSTWRILKNALPSYTDFYLLAGVDLQRDDRGAIVPTAPENAIYRDVLVRTFVISLSVTLICLVLGYPLAYLIATSPQRTANILLLLVLLPFWTSLLVRTTAWVVLLQSKGAVNSFLAWIGLIDPDHGLALIYNRTGVLIAMTHILLPFMVLPIYSVMKGISPVYMRAAASLGAPPPAAFLRIYLPLSLPGISAGCLLVFILALGYYITPSLVGGPRDQMVSYFIAYFASTVTNWGMAAALSAILLSLVLVLYMVYSRFVGLDRLRIG